MYLLIRTFLQIMVRYNADGKVSEVLDALARLVNVNPKSVSFKKTEN